MKETDDINKLNSNFYNESGTTFDAIPFSPLLPELLQKYLNGHELLEIGSGPGALAVWLKERGFQVTCLEPAKKLAEMASKKGLDVRPLTLQVFETTFQYDCIIALSSLIHIPKKELPTQLRKIVSLLKTRGLFVASFILGEGESFEDPTNLGRLRFFAKWTEVELNNLFSPDFNTVESHKIHNAKMNQTFLLNVYALKT